MEELIKEWGYIILFLYSFGGGFLALVFAGVLSYSGELNIFICIVTSGVSNFLGDQFLFIIARKNKNYAKQMMSQYSRKVAYSHLLIRKYGSIVVFFQKYLYGIKTLVPLAMGLSKYNFTQFTILNIIATFLWSFIIGFVGFYMGEVVLNLADEFKISLVIKMFKSVIKSFTCKFFKSFSFLI